MIKKILFILGSFLVGFLLITISINVTMASVVQKRTSEAVANKNYLEAERYFSGLIDTTEGNMYKFTQEDGTHIEIYYGLSNANHTFKDKDGNDTTYQTIEMGIHFAIYHLPEAFKLEDEEGKNGGIRLNFENGGELFFPFVTSEINYYNYVAGYSFLPFIIEYQELAKSGTEITLDALIDSVDILDGSGTEKYVLNTPGLTFANSMYDDFYQILSNYYLYQESILNGAEEDENTSLTISENYQDTIEGNPNYVLQHSQSIITGSSDFLVPVIIVTVIFLALDILLAWLFFRKKKVTKYIPPYQRAQHEATQPQQQEQYSREVFDVVDYDENEEVSEEKPETDE